VAPSILTVTLSPETVSATSSLLPTAPYHPSNSTNSVPTLPTTTDSVSPFPTFTPLPSSNGTDCFFNWECTPTNPGRRFSVASAVRLRHSCCVIGSAIWLARSWVESWANDEVLEYDDFARTHDHLIYARTTVATVNKLVLP
jgi:hypothetical protein